MPFDFDIHALIESSNAPVLEHRLHKRFLAMQVNKMNARKEFFRVPLSDIHSEIEQLQQGDDFTITVWTEKAIATEYGDSLEIENDPGKKDRWLARQKALAERQLRLDSLRIPTSDGASDGDAADEVP